MTDEPQFLASRTYDEPVAFAKQPRGVELRALAVHLGAHVTRVVVEVRNSRDEEIGVVAGTLMVRRRMALLRPKVVQGPRERYPVEPGATVVLELDWERALPPDTLWVLPAVRVGSVGLPVREWPAILPFA